jgi:multifunctional methyltransferase subunit TRM112
MIILSRRNLDTNANTFYQLGFPTLPPTAPTPEELAADEKMQKELHSLLMETQISEGKLVCGNCGHEYAIREGIANFLLPNHLV